MESQWTPKFLENVLKCQNSLDWRFLYTIEKLIKHKCLKWGFIIHLSAKTTSYVWNKNKESKCQFDSQQLQVKNHLDLHVCRGRVTYHWKFIDDGYNFAINYASIKGLHKKLWASKMVGVPRKMSFVCGPHGKSQRIL